ncbi:hypothetical protein Bca52824_026831 [Brassica carinata]|uniref:Ubiquitin-like protease family profile domain-containing protein n=1 Tax=Brassica carinata TaxID=52824 RepID=A0A8X7SIL8_BRACI|nr:hypothetical protein Bca52824_026831 [Brassica carinata]
MTGETVQPYVCSSEEAEAGETSETGVEEEVETAHVSPAKKRKNQYQDVGAESRKKRLLCQRSTDKYRDLEEEMKSYIQGMFKSSFTALGLEVRDLIEDRFTKLEEKLLSSQTQVGVPAYTQTRGANTAYTHTPAAATTSTQARARTPVSTHTSARAPTTSCSRASGPSNNGGPANATKTRSQTKTCLMCGSLFSTLDVNLGTQEHLQKTMGNLTQESNVDGFDPSQDNQSDNPSAFSTPMTSFRPEIFKRPFLTDIDDPEVRCKDSDYELIGPSTFDTELVSRIMGPNIWLKNYNMDTMMYLFQEKTSLRRWKPDRVAIMNCMFSNQIITAYGKFDGNMRGYKLDNNLLEYGRGELPYHGSTGSVWNVDVDRLYIPICLKQIHWKSMCVNLVNRTVEYTVSYVPMRGLSMSGNDCGVYSLKFIECHLLGLDFSLVNDENIQEARHKIAFDLWEAATDEVLQYRMSTFKPP